MTISISSMVYSKKYNVTFIKISLKQTNTCGHASMIMVISVEKNNSSRIVIYQFVFY